jgi:hypothetical protein
MQQFCTYGSVRGVPGNRHPYRDESAGKSRQRVKGESPYIVMASDQL